MEIQSLWQQIADNWLLVWMGTFFLLVILWVMRPGSRKQYADTANIPFRNEDKPAGVRDDTDKALKAKELQS
ncbi:MULTISPECIES: cbb3-type cytochrome c oxidase subunit 3 [unclassified Yoonia]|uniref:cbb3-type cytochrome oxidase subunit 3 n=1 Tax=unclassified Yoonia TaxID=2629118 RepID=UPI002AFF26F3|nr:MULTISPECIES: cbb3-type cytochrome c oxidase subunit 3 [unclassified Yoonia]